MDGFDRRSYHEMSSAYSSVDGIGTQSNSCGSIDLYVVSLSAFFAVVYIILKIKPLAEV